MSTLCHPNKRILLLSDGTWQFLAQPIPTNISRLPALIPPLSPSSIPQLLRYDPGVGSTNSPLYHLTGGVWGWGLDQNIKELYIFLANNYVPGDHVFIFGFSRGAYTVRSLVGFIHVAGLLKRKFIRKVDDAFELYRSGKRAHHPDAKKFRRRYGGSIPIKALVCFDTIGSLGIPVELPPPFDQVAGSDRYRFHDTTLSPEVEHAIHILSIDENRAKFKPTLMKPNPKRGKSQLTQLYFPGGHGGVGGGQAGEERFSDNTLKFLVEEMERRKTGLEWNMDLVPKKINLRGTMRTSDGVRYRVIKWYGGENHRRVKRLTDCHESVIERYAQVKGWRPKALEGIEKDLKEEVRKLRRK